MWLEYGSSMRTWSGSIATAVICIRLTNGEWSRNCSISSAPLLGADGIDALPTVASRSGGHELARRLLEAHVAGHGRIDPLPKRMSVEERLDVGGAVPAHHALVGAVPLDGLAAH